MVQVLLVMYSVIYQQLLARKTTILLISIENLLPSLGVLFHLIAWQKTKKTGRDKRKPLRLWVKCVSSQSTV